MFFIFPLFKEINENSADLASQKEKLFILERQYSQAENFQENYESYKSNLEKIDASFVDPQNLVNFIEFLEKKSSETGMQLQMSAPSFPQKEASKFAIFNLSFVGDFPQVLKFIRSLELGPFLVESRILTAENYKDPNQKTETENTPKIRANLSIKVLIKKQ
jgi:hypothetical protein